MDPDPDPGIHIWEKWMDPDPRIHLSVIVDPDPRKEIEVDPDPDLDPERGLKWIRIRPKAVDPVGSGSETLFPNHAFVKK